MSKRIQIIRIIIYLLMAAMIILLTVQYDSLPKGAEALYIFVNGGRPGESIDMYAGEEASLDYRIVPDAFADRSISWEIEDEAIAFINGEGKLLALNEGQTVLIAEAAGFTENILINVKDSVVSIKGFKTDVTVDIGYSYTITPEVEMAVKGMEAPGLIFESDDETKVTVSSQGQITAVGSGTAHVTVKAGSKSKQIIVRVREPELAPTEPDPAPAEPDDSVGQMDTYHWAWSLLPWF